MTDPHSEDHRGPRKKNGPPYYHPVGGGCISRGQGLINRHVLTDRFYPREAEISLSRKTVTKTHIEGMARPPKERPLTATERQQRRRLRLRNLDEGVQADDASSIGAEAKRSRRRSPRGVLSDISNDEAAPATARVAAARALLAQPKPPRQRKAVEEDDPITRRALQIAAERNRSIN